MSRSSTARRPRCSSTSFARSAGTVPAVPLDVGLVGLPGSGKTSLFTALSGVAGGAYGKEPVAIAPIPDERLEPIAAIEGSTRTTPATVRVVDPPGLSPAVLGEPGRPTC